MSSLKVLVELYATRKRLGLHRLFVIYLIGLYRLLHPPPGITNSLQGRGVDIIVAYEDVSSVIKDIISTRKNTDKEFSEFLNKPNE